ncbi:hypothetical protein [Paraburkholderia youngii]|uniref:hypothetical protein n=1 Tax=Paraburkholderia youngii TaxID=2782701 RepID=UPI00159224DC|nr:hypothetical protein [Paraburkholderia youngii]NUX59291.1 hypothetical protein [Paraburkholderia youngii]
MKLEELFPTTLEGVFLLAQNQVLEALQEGKWITGRFEANIRIDQPTHLHGDGQPHAHVLGRKGNELGVVNLDGTASHGSKFKLHDKDAAALRARGFDVSPDNVVEWLFISTMPLVLLE